MILIVSTNPTVDRTIGVPVLVPHQVHRATSLHISAGGKGLNVGRASKTLGEPYLVSGFLGGSSGQLLQRLIAQEDIAASWLKFADLETKMSHLLRHSHGDSTVINEPGPTLSKAHWQELVAFILEQGRRSQAAILAGSVPPGVEAQDYRQLCISLAQQVGQTLVDTPGETLKAIIAAPQGLAVKVNSDELGEALEKPVSTLGEVIEAARCVFERGAALVCVTMGESGALALNGQGVWRCSYSVDNVVSSVGSGDSFSAGLSLHCSRHLPLPEALRWASACGAANAETSLPAVFSLARVKALLPLIHIEKL